MIFDCFSYLDEDLLLEIRLNILNDYVDYFVIVEGNKTWQNNPKKLRFNIDKFDKFKKKIIYVPVEDLPSGPDPYLTIAGIFLWLFAYWVLCEGLQIWRFTKLPGPVAISKDWF